MHAWSRLLLLTVLAMVFHLPVVGQEADSILDADIEATKDGPLAGHSNHGETFNEGPRQAAYLLDTVGAVRFDISTDSEEVQSFFNQGVGQLHGFWYLEAERSFRQAAAMDPDCAMPYWGMAMANDNNRKRAQGFIQEAVDRIDSTSVREQLWINALAAYLDNDSGSRKERQKQFAADLEAIVDAHPDDLEAKAFLGFALWHGSQRGVKVESHEDVNAILEEVFAVQPNHPAHHYVIHLWDYKDASRALHSAAMCGPSAPGIAHMWHMPGHIYSNLHRYGDAAWQQEASARVDHAQMMRDGLMPDQIFNFAHNNEWLVRNLINVGRIHDAIDLATNMIELPRHPKYNKIDGRGSGKYGRMRLFQILARFEMWPEMLELCDTVTLEPTDIPSEQIKRLKYQGIARYMTGDIVGGDETLAAIELVESIGAERSAENAAKELKSYQLLCTGQAGEAAELYEDVSRRDRLTQAMMLAAAGEYDEAIRIAEKEANRRDDTTRPLACLACIQQEAGRNEEAEQTFEQLRVISADIDLDVPVFARLQTVAVACDAPEDWRLPRADPGDLGERPDLDSLGPFRWRPSPAMSWSLPDAEGGTVSLADYSGKPVVVIFYLGFGCLHCVEQLQAFAPLTESFNEAGIEIVALGSDSIADLKQSLEDYQADSGGDGPAFPFPLVSDSDLDVFKAYRAYDDFEQMTLHGTFLIDANGLVRWQDISYEPFVNTEFLLDEAKRLLAQPVWD